MNVKYIAASIVGILGLGAQNAIAACDHSVNPLCVTVIAETTTTWDGAPMEYLKTRHPMMSVRTVELAPGAANSWHIHEAPQYIYVEKGSFEVFLDDGRNMTWQAGEAFNEVVHTLHFGRNPGTEPTRLIVISATQEDCPFMTMPGEELQCTNGDGHRNRHHGHHGD